jgi:hypothetical protein
MKNLMAFVLAAAFAVVVLRATGESDTNSPTSTSASAPASEPASGPAAPKLGGMKFLSAEKREVGMTPNGLAMGHWHLTFMDKEVHWQHSDMVEVLTYTVAADGTIKATRKFGQDEKAITAKYDAAKKEIVWEKVTYKAK